ncbi:hypothetical protein C498_09731 [Haloferax volcanii DS2]|uniref:Uncharacterized protein n=1 Tax=Haloferax volcanii (strain ATCC 29605 / DSM 3757 / JCM 8879 / NBRC 14742 / NCIMB 2012 / VKM B-1768 / DS2) TaxID=309800 RepID=L9V4Z7_HALVD|nr:hypothetical protein C498_09731 [Haloferax volcanii DS2]
MTDTEASLRIIVCANLFNDSVPRELTSLWKVRPSIVVFPAEDVNGYSMLVQESECARIERNLSVEIERIDRLYWEVLRLPFERIDT